MSQQSTEELRGRDYVIALLWLTRARAAAASGLQTTFILRPGGVAGGNVYTSWPSLYAALTRVAGPKWIEIDDSIVSPAVVPAGAYALDQVRISGKGPASGLELAAGVTFTATTLTIENLLVTSNVTGPVWTYTSATIGALYLTAAAVACNNAASPFLLVSGAGAEVVAIGFEASIGDGTHEVLGSAAGGTLEINFVASLATGDSLAGAATSLFYDAASTVNLPQPVGVSLFPISQASNTTYTAATVANWSGTNPTSVANALDRIAAHSGPIP